MMKRVEINEEKIRQLEEEEKKERNRKILKVLAFIFIPLFVIFVSAYVLLRYIGNIGIVVREYPVYSSNISTYLDGIKIVQFSDIHYNQYSQMDNINELVNLINKTNPDIVIFTGDLIEENYQLSLNEKEEFITKFDKIDASIGKFAIKGEIDFDDFEEIFNNSNFEILDNEIKNIYKDNDYLQLIAVNDNYQVYSSLLENLDTSKFSIAITHMPDNSDKIIEIFSPNIIVAGHSHNGQVRLPFIGPMMKRIGSKTYIDSYYEINNTKLFISGGLGNTKYNFRLFNHPSINFFRLKTSA